MEAEEKWLREKSRGHLARHLARYLAAATVALAIALLVLLVEGSRSRAGLYAELREAADFVNEAVQAIDANEKAAEKDGWTTMDFDGKARKAHAESLKILLNSALKKIRTTDGN